MITDYDRPSTLDSALELLERKNPETVPIAGGTQLDRRSDRPFAVVDLQDLPLKAVVHDNDSIKIGSMLTLQDIVLNKELPEVLRKACRSEKNLNLRQMSTIGGCAAASDGRSVLLAMLLAWNAGLELLPGGSFLPIGEVLQLRQKKLHQKLIASIKLNTTVRLASEVVTKTPGDKPIVGVTIALWPNLRTRVVVFGFGPIPQLAMDGPSSDGAEMAAKHAFMDSSDINASSLYRMDMAETLVKRCLSNLSGEAR